jgi:hypothetical protein
MLLLLLLSAAAAPQVGREDEFSINRQQMLARILVSMGGTVAEELVFGRDQVRRAASCTCVCKWVRTKLQRSCSAYVTR